MELAHAIHGKYRERYLVVSHRWATPLHPDPECVQLTALQRWLRVHPRIEWVWVDFWCLPQNTEEMERTAEETEYFHRSLEAMYMLFLGFHVLIIFDFQYVGRFWTSYECWLSSHEVGRSGFESFPRGGSGSGRSNRVDVVSVGAAARAPCHAMLDVWSDLSVANARAALGEDDIVVTNQKDKKGQLCVLDTLHKEVQSIYAYTIRLPRFTSASSSLSTHSPDSTLSGSSRRRTRCVTLPGPQVAWVCGDDSPHSGRPASPASTH